MKKLWSDQVLFYSMSDDYHNYFELIYDFDEQLDAAVMQKALDTAVTRYPYFKVKLVSSHDEYMLDDNELPLLVYSDGNIPTLDPSENNGYLFRVSVSGCTLDIAFCHALSDGTSVTPFGMTIIYYYWLYKTGKAPLMPDVRLAGTPIPESEINDPTFGASFEPSDIPVPKAPQAYILPEQPELQDGVHVYTFSIDVAPLMKYSHDIDGSPNALAALFMSRAVRAVHKDADPVVAGIALNQRTALKAPDATGCHVGLMAIPYLPRMDSMDISTCATCFRGSIILKSDPDVVRSDLARAQQFHAYLSSLPTLQQKCQMSTGAVKAGISSATFSVSYTGKRSYGELDSHIRFFATVIDMRASKIGIEIMNAGPKFFVTVNQCFRTDAYVKEFIRQFENAGIECTGLEYSVHPYIKAPKAQQI